MTFKEKLKKEKPGLIDDRYTGGCKGCPHGYGYEEEKPCKGINDEECTKCWNREMPNTPVPMTAEEAWEIAKKVALTTELVKTARIFIDKNISGIGRTRLFEEVFALTPQEAKAKIDEWENKQIQVGDVVTEGSSHEYIVIATSKEMPNGQPLLRSLYDHNLVVFGSDGVIKKTGKHIDILSVLNQIGKEE